MNDSTSKLQTILFADVAGSTSLYDQIGDVDAQSRIAKCLEFMTTICTRHNGNLVKHIGDEILCRFDSAEDGILAISEIQNTAQDEPSISRYNLHVRAGLNTGMTIIKESDVFGDTVNVAARMAALANEDQIICTEDTINAIQDDTSISSRALDPLFVKGKENKINVYEILWAPEDTELTAFFSAKDVLEKTEEWSVRLNCGNTNALINKARSKVEIGRSNDNSFVVASPHASRQHARIISRWGKAVLIDQSTNGTYVKYRNGTQYFVHREEFSLSESGEISLGVPSEQNPSHVIYYEYLNK